MVFKISVAFSVFSCSLIMFLNMRPDTSGNTGIMEVMRMAQSSCAQASLGYLP